MKILLILSIILLAIACTSTPELFNKKANPALQQKVKESENSVDKFSVFFKVSNELSEEQKKQVEDLGIKLLSFKGKILSASANSEAVKKLAELDFVESIELSGKSYPVN